MIRFVPSKVSKCDLSNLSILTFYSAYFKKC